MLITNHVKDAYRGDIYICKFVIYNINFIVVIGKVLLTDIKVFLQYKILFKATD